MKRNSASIIGPRVLALFSRHFYPRPMNGCLPEANRAVPCSAAPAGEEPGDEGDGEQCHGTDLLHRLADALGEQANAFARRGSHARSPSLRPPSKEGKRGEDECAKERESGGDNPGSRSRGEAMVRDQ